jgi:hypothetical protein
LNFILDFVTADPLAAHFAQGPRALTAPHIARWIAGQPPIPNPSARHSMQLWL